MKGMSAQALIFSILLILVSGCVTPPRIPERTPEKIQLAQAVKDGETQNTWTVLVSDEEGESQSYNNRIVDIVTGGEEEKVKDMYAKLPAQVWRELQYVNHIRIDDVEATQVVKGTAALISCAQETASRSHALNQLLNDTCVSAGYVNDPESLIRLHMDYEERICVSYVDFIQMPWSRTWTDVLGDMPDMATLWLVLDNQAKIPRFDRLQSGNRVDVSGTFFVITTYSDHTRDRVPSLISVSAAITDPFSSPELPVSKQIRFNVKISHQEHGVVREMGFSSILDDEEDPDTLIRDFLRVRWPFANGVDELSKELHHTDAVVRRSASTALGLIYPDKANSTLDRLRRLHEEDNAWRVRRAAGIAVQRIEKGNP